MAEVAGYGGSITCSDLDAGVKAWTLNLVGDVLETTDYDDSGHRNYIAGVDSWTGSCEVNWDYLNKSLVIGAKITTLIFTIDSSRYYSGATAFVTGIVVGSTVDGLTTMSVTFQGSAVMTPPT